MTPINANFSAALTAIYDAATNSKLWPLALTAISACFDDIGTILLYNRDDGGFEALCSPSLNECLALYMRDGWNFRDIRAIRSRELGYFSERDVITDRDVVSDEEIESDPFYTEFLGSYGLKYFAAAMVSPSKHIEVAISVQRAAGKPPYSDLERELLQAIGRHVEHALRLSARLADADLIATGLAEALKRVKAGVFVVDSMRRILLSNGIADNLIGEAFQVVDQRLEFMHLKNAIGPSAAELVAIDRSRASDVSTAPILLHRKAEGWPYIVYLIPLTPDDATDFLSRAHTIVLIIDPKEEGPPDPNILRDTLGVTLGEAKVAALVGTGLAPKDAAKALGISDETVRTVLKRLYSKVGISRQSELSGLVARLRLGPAPSDI